MWSGGRLTKIQTTTRPDYVCRSFGQDCSSRTELGTNRNLQKISWSSIMLQHWEVFTLLNQTTENTLIFSKMQEEKLERLSAPATPCKRHPSIVKTSTKPKIGPEKELKTMCDCPLRAEKFGVFISADHKVLSERWESRDNHRYVVVVCVYGQLDGIWESMWGFVMESQHFNTSSIRDKCHRWDSVECYCHLRNVQDLLADGITPYERLFGEHSKGQ